MELRFEPLKDELSTELQGLCRGAMPAGDVRVYPSGTVITSAFQASAQEILDLEVREDDIWVISFPKCGESHSLLDLTTSRIIWQLLVSFKWILAANFVGRPFGVCQTHNILGCEPQKS